MSLKVNLTVKPTDQSELRRALLPKRKKKDQKTAGETKRKKTDQKAPEVSKRKKKDQETPDETKTKKKDQKTPDEDKKDRQKKKVSPEKTFKGRGKGQKVKDGKDDADPGPSDETGEPRVYGCSRCRFAAKGCKTCKNPDFKPRARRTGSERGEDVD